MYTPALAPLVLPLAVLEKETLWLLLFEFDMVDVVVIELKLAFETSDVCDVEWVEDNVHEPVLFIAFENFFNVNTSFEKAIFFSLNVSINPASWLLHNQSMLTSCIVGP